MRLFSTPEGDAGFALKGDDIVSVFKHPQAPYRGVTKSMLDIATQEGGRRLDAFDTVLPRLYSQSGFRAVARLPFNDKYAPEGWSHEHFKAFNGGRPDVVFMAHDPQAGLYSPWDGQRIAEYEHGEHHQRAALDEVARRGNAPATPGPESYGSGQLIRLGEGQAPTTIWHGTPHTFGPTRANPLGEFDLSKIGTGEGNQSYAYGPYAAGNEAIASGYRNDLSGGVTHKGAPTALYGFDPQDTAIKKVGDLMDDHHIAADRAIEHLKSQYDHAIKSHERFGQLGSNTPAAQANAERAQFNRQVLAELSQLDPNDFAHNKGNLYQAELHIHPDHMLDWDKKISEHSPYVQQRLQKMFGLPEGFLPDSSGGWVNSSSMTGQGVHEMLHHRHGGQEKGHAARALLEAGIPGIRYLDASSRNAPKLSDVEMQNLRDAVAHKQAMIADPKQQRDIALHQQDLDLFQRRLKEAESVTHNYVVFDPRTIHIVKRNGLPAMIDAGADALRDHKQGGGT